MSVTEGEIWVGRAHGIKGRVIMVTGIEDRQVSYEVLAPSPETGRSNRPGGMVVTSLRQAYRRADEEEVAAVTSGPERVIDLTQGQRLAPRYVEVKTEAWTIRVSVNLEAAGERVVVVEAEPDGGWGTESELSWTGRTRLRMRPDR